MANLVVRNVDKAIVKALKERAGRSGHSAEEKKGVSFTKE